MERAGEVMGGEVGGGEIGREEEGEAKAGTEGDRGGRRRQRGGYRR